MKSRRVLNVIGSLDKSWGGPSRSVPQTCKYASELGIDITIVARSSLNPVSITTSNKLRVINRSLIGLIYFFIRLPKDEYDLIHLQHIWDPYIHIAAFFARIKKIPYMITPRGMLEPYIMNRNKWKKDLAMLFYQRYDINRSKIIHATCQMEKDNVRNLGFNNSIVVIPNGLVIVGKKEMKINFERKKVIFLSRLHVKKGIELLIDAWQKIDTDGWTLEIAGEGDVDYVKKLTGIVASNNIENVKFTGPLYGDEKWDFLRSGDIFILPTYSENFGNVVVESLSVGVPVITTKGTPWEELDKNGCGWWIDLSVNNISKALQEGMLKSKDELRIMGRNGRRLVEKKYDIKIIAKNMVDNYNHIISY